MNGQGRGFTTCRGLAVVAAVLLVAGCQQAEVDQESGVVESTGQDGPAAAPVARTLGADDVGARYCLERTVPDDSDGEKVMRFPVVGIQKKGLPAWHTLKPIKLGIVSEPTYCPVVPVLGSSDRLTVTNRADGGFRIRLERDGRQVMDRVAEWPEDGTDAYLYAPAECQSGSADCSGLRALEAFVYVLEDPDRSRRLRKLVKIDLFPPKSDNPSSREKQCYAERPDSGAMKKRTAATGPCTGLPPWHASLLEAKVPDSQSANLQTGTGSGYEPP